MQPPAIIAFTKVKLPFGWLSNMSPHPIEANDQTWKTAEALFHALRFDDLAIQEEIRAQKSPMAAKIAAGRHWNRLVIEPHSPDDVDNMRVVLRLKILQHHDLRSELLHTGTSQIIEDCSARPQGSGLFWGAAFRQQVWVGENKLGKLWMELRDECRSRRVPRRLSQV